MKNLTLKKAAIFLAFFCILLGFVGLLFEIMEFTALFFPGLILALLALPPNKIDLGKITGQSFTVVIDKLPSLKLLKYPAILIILAAALITIYDEFRYQTGYYDDLFADEEIYQDDQEITASGCNVYGVELHGTLVTYISPENLDRSELLVDEVASENIVFAIEELEKDNTVKAIVLEIDSYGGMPVAAEEVANALKLAEKPTVALIRGAGASAAYWVASGADMIFASKNSDVGSIGVTMSYLDYSKQNQQEGITYNEVSSGKFKDTANPDKPLTAEEKQLLIRDVKIVYQNFVEEVAENRGLEVEAVKKLADGSSMLGQMAMDNGLIDQIGGMSEVKEYLKQIINEEIDVCW